MNETIEEYYDSQRRELLHEQQEITDKLKNLDKVTQEWQEKNRDATLLAIKQVFGQKIPSLADRLLLIEILLLIKDGSRSSIINQISEAVHDDRGLHRLILETQIQQLNYELRHTYQTTNARQLKQRNNTNQLRLKKLAELSELKNMNSNKTEK